MEKLYKVVCANYALDNRKLLKCSAKLEDSVDEALIMFIGVGMQRYKLEEVLNFIGDDIERLHLFQEKFSKKKGTRFNNKFKLIQNGMNL